MSAHGCGFNRRRSIGIPWWAFRKTVHDPERSFRPLSGKWLLAEIERTMPNSVVQLHKHLGCYPLRKQTCYSQAIEEMVSVDFFPVSASSLLYEVGLIDGQRLPQGGQLFFSHSHKCLDFILRLFRTT